MTDPRTEEYASDVTVLGPSMLRLVALRFLLFNASYTAFIASLLLHVNPRGRKKKSAAIASTENGN